MSDAFWKALEKLAARQGLDPAPPLTQMPIDPQPRQPLQVPPTVSDNAQLAAAWARPATDAARLAELQAARMSYANALGCDVGSIHETIRATLARIAALEAEVARLRADALTMRDLLREASGDLAAYINSECPPETCDDHPAIMSKRERDYDIVRRIVAEIERQDRTALGAGQ